MVWSVIANGVSTCFLGGLCVYKIKLMALLVNCHLSLPSLTISVIMHVYGDANWVYM